MQELLLINPATSLRPRGRKGKSMATKKSRKAPSAKQRANWARFAKMARERARQARSGSRKTSASSARKRARNPVTSHTSAIKRRRNPIALGGIARGLGAQLRDAAVGAAGSITMDVLYGQIARFLPASMQRTPTAVGLGDAVKAVATVVAGNLLAGPTKGLSRRMATGALIVQATELARRFIPTAMPLGYASPLQIVQGGARVGPNQQRMGAYVPGVPPLLNAYTTGAPPILSQRMPTSMREAIRR